MRTKIYNGFANHETRLVWTHFGDSLAAHVNYIEEEITASDAESYVSELLEQDRAFDQTNAACELLSAALDHVNWREIADTANG